MASLNNVKQMLTVASNEKHGRQTDDDDDDDDNNNNNNNNNSNDDDPCLQIAFDATYDT